LPYHAPRFVSAKVHMNPLLAATATYNEWAVLGLLFVIAAGFAVFNVAM